MVVKMDLILAVQFHISKFEVYKLAKMNSTENERSFLTINKL